MQQRQKDVKEKKIRIYFFYYVTLWLFLLATISLMHYKCNKKVLYETPHKFFSDYAINFSKG